MAKYVFLLTAILLDLSSLHSNIVNVPGDYSTINLAISFASNGDTIIAAPGVYYENVNYRGKSIVLTSTYFLTNDPAAIHNTVVNGSKPGNNDTGSCVIISGVTGTEAVLQGFSVTGGSGTKWNDEHGVGLFREGGGILVQFSPATIKNNIIFGNIISDTTGVISTGGGGIRIGSSKVRFHNNLVYGNSARYGAGIVLNFASCDLRNNIISGNYGSFHFGSGAGIWINGDSTEQIKVINNVITGNASSNGFCGIRAGGPYIFKNNIIWGNTSASNIQVSPLLEITYSCIQGGYAGTGNISSEPLFENESYRLSGNSPCIDSGDPATEYNDLPAANSTTEALFPSFGSIRNDIGAYGGQNMEILKFR